MDASGPAMASSMTITIYVPAQLRPYCDGASELLLSAPTVQAALEWIEQRHPTLYQGVCDETGRVRRHVNLFVNSNHVRDLQGLDTPLESGDTLLILPAVSGG
jgi:sulfur-carrier protein